MFTAKMRIVRASVILAGVFLIVLVGCDRAGRHKVLTFFFEGVPPLESDSQTDDKQTPAEESPELVAAKQEAARSDSQRGSSTHEPGKDCYQCHMKQGGWDQERLAEPLPDLCYSCHTDYNAASGYLHGPIAAGDCVFCHDPHQTGYVHLQKAPQPKLCYQCHLPEDIESEAHHQDLESRACTECHDPHIGSTRNLLKSNLETKDSSSLTDIDK